MTRLRQKFKRLKKAHKDLQRKYIMMQPAALHEMFTGLRVAPRTMEFARLLDRRGYDSPEEIEEVLQQMDLRAAAEFGNALLENQLISRTITKELKFDPGLQLVVYRLTVMPPKEGGQDD